MHHLRPILALGVSIAFLFLSSTAAALTPGVTNNAIVLGQSAVFSGPSAKLGAAMREGALSYFDDVNADGGINGRKVKLESLDDGYEPDRAKANTERLIRDDKVFALFGYVGTPTSYAVLPMVTAARVPFFAPFTGAQGLREPFNRYVFNIRASYFDETEQLVNWLNLNYKKRIAVFYQDDAYGKAGLDGVTRAMSRRGLQIVSTGTVQRNTVEVADAVRTIHTGRPQAVILISAYTSCAAFIKAYHARWPADDPSYLNVSFVGSEALAHELGSDGDGVIISQVVPYYLDPYYAVATEFRQSLARHFPDSKPSFNNLEGYMAARTFVEGLRRAGPDLTRDNFIAALETLRNYDLGNFSVTFTPNNHNGSNLVLLTIIVGKETFVPFSADVRRAGGP
ncbi:MAG TPA: ABC transporter substrate-binding protein [Candidatus Methylomirabilis sp.]|nr:ABC transporter substrate-binding protein [Candidatus Methylomirabilis sp.]